MLINVAQFPYFSNSWIFFIAERVNNQLTRLMVQQLKCLMVPRTEDNLKSFDKKKKLNSEN